MILYLMGRRGICILTSSFCDMNEGQLLMAQKSEKLARSQCEN
jgi:hypothetical protein